MDDWEFNRLTADELMAFFDRLFPQGFSGADVLAELAPEGWERSPLLACYHPSPEQVLRERLQMRRNIDEWSNRRRRRDPRDPERAPLPPPTLDEVRAEWREDPVEATQEVSDLVASCLWDVFSDNHEVIAADGRVVDIGSFRGASAFLDEYLLGDRGSWREGDCMRFYMGTCWIQRRADLTVVYRMLFRRLQAMGADWEYHSPQLHIIDFSELRPEATSESPADYSPSASFAREEEERARQEEREQFRAQIDEINQRSRREAWDHPPPRVVLAYQEVFGRDPKGWPPL